MYRDVEILRGKVIGLRFYKWWMEMVEIEYKFRRV